MIKTLVAAFALFVAASPALAEAPLTDDQVTRFIATLAPVEEMGKRLEAEGKIAKLFDEKNPAMGCEFKPYSTGVSELKKDHPGEYAALGGALKPHGFSQDQWAATGDRVMRAYIAVKMEQENPNYAQEMPALDPSMLEQMPPQMRAQIEGALAMVEAVKETPAADKAAVKPHLAAIDAATDRGGFQNRP